MRPKILNIFYLFLSFILFTEISSAQVVGDFRELIPLPSKDTLVINRGLGDWWFGINTGINANFYFSKLRMPLTYSVLDTLIPTPDSLINFPSGFGIGYYVGLYGEWAPKGSKWGASLSLFLQDIHNGTATTPPGPDTTKDVYQATTNFNYISISPSVKYNFDVPGLYALGGLDMDYTLSSKLINILKFQNTGNIDQEKKNLTTITKFRFGVHFGIGYEFLVADISHRFRILFSPYVTINGGSGVMSDFGSSRNTLFARIGLQIKFGPDEIRKDTLQYNPNYRPPPEAYATASRENGPFFPGFMQDLIAFSASPVERVNASEDAAEASNVVNKEKVIVPVEPIKKFSVKLNVRKIYFFQSSPSTTLPKEAKDYLDAVAEFLKENPNSTVRIVGHSDDQGTFSQNQQRSEQRARQVVQYLVSKGIQTGRLFPRGDGARTPLGDNRSEEGRKKNRRVEIVVIQ